MSDNIFSETAPKFYAKGIPVIPLHYHDKRPIPKAWSAFRDHMPTPEEQQQWITHYANCNVGLVLGPKSGMCAIDIDTEDEDLIKIILSVIPESPWKRVGKKGMMLAFKYEGQQTFRIKDSQGNMIVECLSAGTQIVLAPSIHPSTKLPYTENVPLVDVIDALPSLPKQIEEILRGAIEMQGGVELSLSGSTRVVDVVPVGARDVKMTAVAGLFAAGVTKGEMSLLEAVDRLVAWHSSCTEKLAGDDVDVQKGVQNLIKFVTRDVLEKGKVLPPAWDIGLDDETKKAMGLNFTEEHEEWTFDQLKQYLHDEFETHPPDSTGRMNAINYVLDKMAKSKGLNRLDEDRLMRYIVDAGGMKMNMSSLRARIKELSNGDIIGKDHTEIAKAVIEDIEQYGPIRFHASRFWTWGGSHWTEVPNSKILKLIADQYGGMEAAKRASDHNGIMRVMSSLVDQYLGVTEVNGVNFANGVLLESGKLVPHAPEYGMTYTLPYCYKEGESSRAARFMAFLEHCWGLDPDYEDKKKALQEVMCSTLFGKGPLFQKAILLFGPPESGKSQLLRIVSHLLPPEAKATCPPDQWGDKFAPTMMHNKLFNVCGELSEHRRIDGMRFKQIVDGDEMDGQLKGQQIFQFKPVCTHWFASNHPPRTDDTSTAFTRRWLSLIFNRPVTKDEKIQGLGELIAAEEREAIVSWVVEALPRIMKSNSYTTPISHERFIEDVANINNSVRFFIRESGMVRIGPALEDGKKTSAITSSTDLHFAYSNFCLGEGGAKPVGPRAFSMKMRELSTEFNFKEVHQVTEAGLRQILYDGITLVGSRVK